jgi:endoglucanase
LRSSHRRILGSILSQPTAPFHEDAVVACVRTWAKGRGLSFRRDAAGNVLLGYRGVPGGGRPRWLFAAHMDHPGFVVRRRRRQTVWADFIGHVHPTYFPRSRVRLFCPDGEVIATVSRLRKVRGREFPSCALELTSQVDVPAGTVGMWDLPAVRFHGGRIAARACDDLAGVAAVLCAMDDLVRRAARADVTALLTRAEEAGLIGAMAACEQRTMPRRAWIVGVEASRAQPWAPLGGGAVIRVGDRMRTFDPLLTAHVASVAGQLARRDRRFRCRRHLMPGGTCESTVYSMSGRTAAALCLPLANYHNMGPGGRIAPERIDTSDFESLVKLLAALALGGEPAETGRDTRDRLDRLFRRRRGLLNG